MNLVMRAYHQHRHEDTRNLPIGAPEIVANNLDDETDCEDAEADLFKEYGMMST